jgi:hypothetical protein
MVWLWLRMAHQKTASFINLTIERKSGEKGSWEKRAGRSWRSTMRGALSQKQIDGIKHNKRSCNAATSHLAQQFKQKTCSWAATHAHSGSSLLQVLVAAMRPRKLLSRQNHLFFCLTGAIAVIPPGHADLFLTRFS